MLLEYRHSESPSLAVTVGERENSKQPDTKQSAEFGRKTSKHLGGCGRLCGVANRRSRNWGSVLLCSGLHTLPNGVDAERVGVTFWHSSGTTGASLVSTLEGGMQKGARAGPTGCQNRYESYWPPEVLLDSRREYEQEHGDVQGGPRVGVLPD